MGNLHVTLSKNQCRVAVAFDLRREERCHRAWHGDELRLALTRADFRHVRAQGNDRLFRYLGQIVNVVLRSSSRSPFRRRREHRLVGRSKALVERVARHQTRRGASKCVALAQVERHGATISISHARLPGRGSSMDRRNRLASIPEFLPACFRESFCGVKPRSGVAGLVDSDGTNFAVRGGCFSLANLLNPSAGHFGITRVFRRCRTPARIDPR